MQQTQLGRTGLNVSRFCLGLMSYAFQDELYGRPEDFAVIERLDRDGFLEILPQRGARIREPTARASTARPFSATR